MEVQCDPVVLVTLGPLHFDYYIECLLYPMTLYRGSTVFLLLLYSDYKVAETLQKKNHFCIYPVVYAEIETIL